MLGFLCVEIIWMTGRLEESGGAEKQSSGENAEILISVCRIPGRLRDVEDCTIARYSKYGCGRYKPLQETDPGGVSYL